MVILDFHYHISSGEWFHKTLLDMSIRYDLLENVMSLYTKIIMIIFHFQTLAALKKHKEVSQRKKFDYKQALLFRREMLIGKGVNKWIEVCL